VTTARPRRRLVATVLAALCVLTLLGGIIMVLVLNGKKDDQERARADRVAAVQAAQRFTETFNSFKPSEVEAYVDRVAPLLSTKFRTEFTDGAQDVATGIEQQRLSSTGEVLVDAEGIPLVGIGTIDDDSAEVLVVSDAQRVASGQRVLRHWRWQVSLVKVDDEWLVDSFKEV
jgi:hypothetical protein